MEVFQLVHGPIRCAAWNKDKTGINLAYNLAVAVGTNNEKVYILQRGHEKWSIVETLSKHDQDITGIDWWSGPDGIERLITCSSDRNSYVWTRSEASTWKPVLVLLRLRRAASVVRWSPCGRKFAVGGVEGVVAVGYYEKDNDWWVCKHLKKPIDQAVQSICWNPIKHEIAVGSIDGKVHVVDAWIRGVDSEKGSFNESIYSLELKGGWVRDVAYSPDGKCLAALTGGCITVYYHDTQFRSTIPVEKQLVYTKLCFVSNNVVFLAGHPDAPPVLIAGKNGIGWTIQETLDPIRSPRNIDTNAFGGAMAKFRNMDKTNCTTEHIRAHFSIVSSALAWSIRERKASKVITAGLDGRMCLWDVSLAAVRLETRLSQVG